MLVTEWDVFRAIDLARLGVAMPAVAPSPASLWDASPSPPPAPVDKVIAAYDRAVKEALDHGTDEEGDAMEEIERAALSELGIADPYAED